MQLRRIATSPIDLVTLEAVKCALGINFPDDVRDVQLETQKIPAAIAYVEDRAGVTLQQTTWEYVRRGWPSHCHFIELPRPPTLCLIEFVHATDCGDWTRVDEDDFRIQESPEGMKIYPCDCWPRVSCCCHTCAGCPPKVRLTYEAGYQAWGDIPANLCEGLAMIVDWLLTRSESSKQIGNQLIDQKSNLRAVGHYA